MWLVLIYWRAPSGESTKFSLVKINSELSEWWINTGSKYKDQCQRHTHNFPEFFIEITPDFSRNPRPLDLISSTYMETTTLTMLWPIMHWVSNSINQMERENGYTIYHSRINVWMTHMKDSRSLAFVLMMFLLSWETKQSTSVHVKRNVDTGVHACSGETTDVETVIVIHMQAYFSYISLRGHSFLDFLTRVSWVHNPPKVIPIFEQGTELPKSL